MSRIKTLKSIASAALCAGFLTACAVQTQTSAPDVNFLSGPRVMIDVSNVSVVDNYISPGAAPNVEHKHSLTPAALAQKWALERLHAAGSGGAATLTIQRASVTEEALPGKSGIEGIVGDYPVAKYVARIAARLTVVKPGNVPGAISTYNAEVNVWSESSVLKNDNLNARDRTYNELMQKIAVQFDQSLTREIQRSMGPLLLAN